MKIRPLSDLHLEFAPVVDIPDTNHDIDSVVVLAGDIGIQNTACSLIVDLSIKFKHVFYLMGTHEYLGGTIPLTIPTIWESITKISNDRDIPTPINVTITQCGSIIIDDIKIIGATLWTNSGKYNPFAHLPEEDDRNYRTIVNSKGVKLAVPFEILHTFKHDIAFLNMEICKAELLKIPVVIVTHYPPFLKSIELSTKTITPIEWYEYVDYTKQLIDHPTVELIIHGHIHESLDYMIGNTRIICNPKGYTSDPIIIENKSFDPTLTIEI